MMTAQSHLPQTDTRRTAASMLAAQWDRAKRRAEALTTHLAKRLERAKSAMANELLWQESMRKPLAKAEIAVTTLAAAGLLIQDKTGECVALQEGINEFGSDLLRLENGEVRFIPKNGQATTFFSNDRLTVQGIGYLLKVFPSGRSAQWVRSQKEKA